MWGKDKWHQKRCRGDRFSSLWPTFSKSMFHSLSCYFSAAQITFLFATQTSPILCFRAFAIACRVQGEISSMLLTYWCWVFLTLLWHAGYRPSQKSDTGQGTRMSAVELRVWQVPFVVSCSWWNPCQTSDQQKGRPLPLGQISEIYYCGIGVYPKESLSSLVLYSERHGFPCSYLEHLFNSFFTIAETWDTDNVTDCPLKPYCGFYFLLMY